MCTVASTTHTSNSRIDGIQMCTHTYIPQCYIYVLLIALLLTFHPLISVVAPHPLPPIQLGTLTSTSPIVDRSPHDHNVRPSLSVDIEGIHPHAHRETQPFSKLLRSMWISDSESEGGNSSQAEHIFEDAAFEAVVNSPPRAEPSEPLAAVGGLAEGARPAGSNSALAAAAEVPTGVEPESGCAAPAAGAAPAVDRPSAVVAAADGAEIHARRRPRVAERIPAFQIQGHGWIKIDSNHGSFNAHCSCLGPPSLRDHRTDTMPECRLHRAMTKAPLGLLLAWLRCGTLCANRDEHYNKRWMITAEDRQAKQPNCTIGTQGTLQCRACRVGRLALWGSQRWVTLV